MAGIIWSPDARFDYERHLTRIAREASWRTAAKWAEKFRNSIQLLEQFPGIGAPVEDVPILGLRERLVGPYRLIYRYDGRDCRILSIPRAEQDLQRILMPEEPH
jgi:plasmid stabilization system protein ParE